MICYKLRLSNLQFMNKKTNNWLIEFTPNYSILFIDLLIRIFLLIPILFKVEYFGYGLNIFLQIFTTLFTLFIANRKSRTIRSFLEMRLLSEQSEESTESEGFVKKNIEFRDVKLQTKTVSIKEDGLFVFLLFLIPVFSLVTIYGQFVIIRDFEFLNGFMKADVFSVFIFLFTGPLVYFFYWWNKDSFLSTKIKRVSKNGRNLSKKRVRELIKFLTRTFTLDIVVDLAEQNDFLIIELQTKIKIYRERLENLSMEGIFLGALSFATLMQLIGPENIEILSGMMTSSGDNDEYFKNILNLIFHSDTWFLKGSYELKLGVGIAIITIGSLLASVFYIIVLIKRFSILKSIEYAQLKIERANSWNEREEKEIKEKNLLKTIRFTDQIQIELASANRICQEVKSNLSLVSFIRSMGTFSFFVVILVTADMIHHYLFIFSMLVAIYGLLASLLMSHSLVGVKSLFHREKSKGLNELHFSFWE